MAATSLSIRPMTLADVPAAWAIQLQAYADPDLHEAVSLLLFTLPPPSVIPPIPHYRSITLNGSWPTTHRAAGWQRPQMKMHSIRASSSSRLHRRRWWWDTWCLTPPGWTTLRCCPMTNGVFRIQRTPTSSMRSLSTLADRVSAWADSSAPRLSSAPGDLVRYTNQEKEEKEDGRSGLWR